MSGTPPLDCPSDGCLSYTDVPTRLQSVIYRPHTAHKDVSSDARPQQLRSWRRSEPRPPATQLAFHANALRRPSRPSRRLLVILLDFLFLQLDSPSPRHTRRQNVHRPHRGPRNPLICLSSVVDHSGAAHRAPQFPRYSFCGISLCDSFLSTLRCLIPGRADLAFACFMSQTC